MKNSRIKFPIIAAVLILVVAIASFFAMAAYHASASEQGASSVRDAILNTAMQCAAIEGAYPQSLEYLEDEYGLVIDHSRYAINYESFASNIVPSVVVRAK